ncbi:MAG: hypothetical protein IT303_11950 [Dehalococcoidia bacterium]|nr:hypothetical protein [Dehalococcoidia bacterium]
MITHPNSDDILEAIQIALERDVLPECTTARGQMAVVLAQALLQMAREVIPVQQQYLAEEFNALKQTLAVMAKELDGVSGPEADRVRERAASFAAQPDFPVIPPLAELLAAHDAVKTALEENMLDTDVLIRGGHGGAMEAVTRYREVMGPMIARDFATMVVGAGMVGRG